jgi:exopolysaccharide biosynthesis polyprenyl glycosylphosphotransferase
VSVAQRVAWIDGLSTLAVLGGALALWPSPADGATDPWAFAARVALVVGLALAAFYYNDLYDFEASHALGHVFTRLCRALGVTAVLLAAGSALFPALGVGSQASSYALLLTLGAVTTARAAVYTLAKREPFVERVIVIGGSALAVELARQLRTRADLSMRLVGFVGEPSASRDAGPHLGGYTDIGDVVRRHRPDRILVAMLDRRGNLPVTELLSCRFRGVAIEEGTLAWERIMRRLAVESLTPSALIFGDGFHVSRAQAMLQRARSVVVSAIGLVLTAPLMALIAVVTKLESPGPVFFVQERIGLGGTPFRVIKFRTMRPATPDQETGRGRPGDVWGRDNESRVTRFGETLRRYRLDELPQFWNILRGDMSLVGPRPEMAANVATFAAVIPFYSLRHEVRPGLTGWAQVKAGYSMSTEEVTTKLCYDLYYVKHMSVAFDLRILFDTVKFVLCGKRPG